MLHARDMRLRPADLLAALSHALDLTEGQPPGHCVRAAWIGQRIGAELGLDPREMGDLYYTVLLKDLGCSSNAARICQLYLTDDRAFKEGFKTMGTATRQALGFVLRHTAPEQGLIARLRQVHRVLRDRDEIVDELMETRCHQGAEIARLMGFPGTVSDGIAALDEHWDGGGRPEGLAGRSIPLAARIALTAQVMDVFHRDGGRDAALAELDARTGRWFDPEVARAARAAARAPDFWARLESPEIESEVTAMDPLQQDWVMDDDRIDNMIAAFGRVIDAKSPFTQGHSRRVAGFTAMLCRVQDWPEDRRRWLTRAALLHDIGKLGVSNTILDKPDRLDEAEFAVVKTHPVLGAEILSRLAPFRPMAKVVAAHHEKLDGRGYPNALPAEALTQEMRLLTVADIFDALTAARPYRAALPMERALAIMQEDAGTALDAGQMGALAEAVDAGAHLSVLGR